MAVISHIKSPMGFYYKYDKDAHRGERITRREAPSGRFGVGQPDFSIQTMSGDELSFVGRFVLAAERGGQF